MRALKALLKDDDVFTCLAVVALHEGETTHWSVNDEGDVQVTVKAHHQQSEITAVLGALVGGAGKGVWMVPPIGTEVVLAFERGEFEGDAVIVGVMPSGSVPDGLADGVVVIAGVQVLIHDGNGGAEPLITRAEFLDHAHGSNGASGPITGGFPVAVPADFPGTTVLKAK